MRIPRTLVAVALALMLAAQPAAARWADWPPISDAELEQIVRGAYTAAAAHARRDNNYFARDGVTDALRSAIEVELGRQNLTMVEVAGEPAADLEAARACAEQGVTLRFAVNMFGDGIDLAAATPTRVFSYHYEPREDAAIQVAPAADCAGR